MVLLYQKLLLNLSFVSSANILEKLVSQLTPSVRKQKSLFFSFGEHLNVACFIPNKSFSTQNQETFPRELVMSLKLSDCKENLKCDFLEACTF